MSANDKNISRAGSGTDMANPGSAAGNKKQGERMQGMLGYYIRYSIPEFILCLVSAVALDVNIIYGFRLTDAMRTSYGLFIGVTAVVLVLLFIFNYNVRTRLVCLPIFAVALVVLVAICYRMGFSFVETDVWENNWGVFYLAVVITAVLAFAASRTRLGSGIFAVVGAFAHAWICVCLWTFSVWALVIFIAAAGVMYLYSRYRHQMMNVAARKHAFVPLLRTSVLAMAVTLALTAGVFFGIVKPLNPPVLDINLVTKVVSIDVIKQVGIYNTVTVMDVIITQGGVAQIPTANFVLIVIDVPRL